MGNIKKLAMITVVGAIVLAGCGDGGMLPTSSTARGDDPVRGTNIINTCETSNTKGVTTTINNTNNCNKNNSTVDSGGAAPSE